MILNVINREELRAFLSRYDEDYGLPSGLAVQALERPLLRRRACLKELRRFPQDAPAWLTGERHAKEKFYRFSEKKLLSNDRLRCDIQIVLEWLKQCVSEKAAWLDARTHDGRYRKLTKLGRLEHLINMVRKERAKGDARLESGSRVGPDARFIQLGQVETILELKGGWRWARPLDEQAFVQEGVHMRNCLAKPEHHARHIRDRNLYSLRDPQNRPRINLSVFSGHIGQCRGRGNSACAPRYHSAIERLIAIYGWRKSFRLVERPSVHCRAPRRVAAFDQKVRFVRGAKIPGSVHIFGDPRLIAVPRNLSVDGDMLIHDCFSLPSLSSGHKVRGNVRISSCDQLHVIEGHMDIGGDLIIEAGRVRIIRGGLRVAGNLKLSGGVHLRSIEGPLTIGGNASIVGTIFLNSLPEGVSIGGDLDIRMSGVRTWPRDIQVGGCVIVASTIQADRVPKHLDVSIPTFRLGGGRDDA